MTTQGESTIQDELQSIDPQLRSELSLICHGGFSSHQESPNKALLENRGSPLSENLYHINLYHIYEYLFCLSASFHTEHIARAVNVSVSDAFLLLREVMGNPEDKDFPSIYLQALFFGEFRMVLETMRSRFPSTAILLDNLHISHFTVSQNHSGQDIDVLHLQLGDQEIALTNEPVYSREGYRRDKERTTRDEIYRLIHKGRDIRQVDLFDQGILSMRMRFLREELSIGRVIAVKEGYEAEYIKWMEMQNIYLMYPRNGKVYDSFISYLQSIRILYNPHTPGKPIVQPQRKRVAPAQPQPQPQPQRYAPPQTPPQPQRVANGMQPPVIDPTIVPDQPSEKPEWANGQTRTCPAIKGYPKEGDIADAPTKLLTANPNGETIEEIELRMRTQHPIFLSKQEVAAQKRSEESIPTKATLNPIPRSD